MKYLPYLSKRTVYYSCGFTVLPRYIHSHLLKKDLWLSYQSSLPKIVSNVLNVKGYLNKSGIQDKIQKVALCVTKPECNIGSINLLHAYSAFISNESSLEPFVLAWAIKMVHAHSLIMEETLNQGINVSNACLVNEADLLRSFLHIMLECQFNDRNQYNDLVYLFHKVFAYKALAKDLERMVPTNGDKHHDFNEQRFNLICEYKTAFQSFTLPFTLAMKLANVTDTKTYTAVESLGSEMGKLYQIKKDFDNCFSGDVIIGPTGTDIQNNRCTWLAVNALQRFTDRQKLVFKACYGSDEPAHVERVKLLYKQVHLPQLFRQTQGEMVEIITKKVEDLKIEGVPSAMFLGILDEIVHDENVSIQESV